VACAGRLVSVSPAIRQASVQKDDVMKGCFAVAALLAIATGSWWGLTAPGPAHAQGGPNARVGFKEDVLPIFQVHCVSCHAPGGQGTEASGLDLTNYQGVMKGTKFGPMVIAGDPEGSNLMRLLDWRASPQLRMPHGKQQLPASERTTIRRWIQQGAKDN
jgi:hypothetical protein